MIIKTFSTESEWLQACVTYYETVINESAPATVALSGGTTVIPVYETIAREAHLTHGLTDIYQVDERYVPPDHADSNQRLIKEHFFRPGRWRRGDPDGNHQLYASVSFFPTELPIDRAVDAYEESIGKAIKNSGGLTLALLGMGKDGHTASLFPGSPALEESKKFVAHTITDNFPIHNRLTLTFPAIMNSRYVLLLLKGKEKQIIFTELMQGGKTFTELPAKKLLTHPNLTLYFGNF